MIVLRLVLNLFIYALLSLPALADNHCDMSFIDTRLITTCKLFRANEKTLPDYIAQKLDYDLKNLGYSSGVGMNYPYAPKVNNVNVSVVPTFDYSTNINGGNPPKQLKLGNLSFTGDEELYLKSGLLVGAAATLNGRYIYGTSTYFDYAINGGFAQSPEHQLGIVKGGFNFCSKNHLKKWWYFDICGGTSRNWKKITNQASNNFNLKVSKTLSDRTPRYYQLSTTLQRYLVEPYAQNQLLFGLETIHEKGFFTEVNFEFGQKVKNQLALSQGVNMKLGSCLDLKEMIR